MASEEEKADEAAAKEFEAKWGGNIHQAAGKGDVPALRHFLRVAPGKVHEKDDEIGRTPLHVAALHGQVVAAELLLCKGAAVDAKDDPGNTPLHAAAQNDRVAAAEFLLSKGAAVDAKDDGGRTPLRDAARNGHVAAVEFLLSKGAAVDAKGNDGRTPLHLAAQFGRVAPAELLLSKGAVVDAKDDGGRTPLHDAARNGHIAAAELLLSKGAAVDAKDNDGKTPLDLAREESETKVEQVLLNPPDAAPHAAGSGAVAVKHQRETSKEEAAKALKKAMESGNVEVLKEAIAAAKAQKVSQEDMLEAMDRYMDLKESADQHELSPAEEAAKALKKAMESGNVEVLKEAIAAAKAQKVSQEDMLEAMDRYMVLKESAATSKAEKSATTSKAESFVKLEPGHGARLAMFSARFNAKNKDTEIKFRAVHKILVDNHYDVLMVEAGEGESYGKLTVEYLGRLKREKGIMLAVCTSDYGEMTDSPFCTYYELQTAVEYKIDVLPLQVEDEWQPNPPCGTGHLDKDQSALGYIYQVFKPSRVRLDCRNKPVEEIASKIAAILRKPV